MNIHFIQHVPFETPAGILTWAEEHQHDSTTTCLFQKNTLPELNSFDLLIIMGGSMGIHDEKQYPWLKQEKEFIARCIEAEKRVAGICLGAQLIAGVLGAEVTRNPEKEIGWFTVKKSAAIKNHPVFTTWPDVFPAFHWHGDTFAIPDGAVPVGSSKACRNQGFIYQDNVIGLQFHLECTRKSIEALLLYCSDELTAGNFIQSRYVIDTITDEKLNPSNQMINDMLTCWMKQEK